MPAGPASGLFMILFRLAEIEHPDFATPRRIHD
jgi:hypothetical protein